MTKVAGVDVLLKVNDEETGELISVGGQTGASLNRSAETIDITNKLSGGWSSAMAGLKSWTIDGEGFISLGDDGQDKLELAYENREKIYAEIRVGASEDATGVTYTGEAVITDLSMEFSQDDAVTFSVALAGASPLSRVVGIIEA